MSKQYTLSTEDKVKWGNNALTFLAPLALLYIGSVTPALQDGLQATDFYITPMVAGALVLYVLNTLTDILKKYTASN